MPEADALRIEELERAIERHRVMTQQKEDGIRWSTKAINDELWAHVEDDEPAPVCPPHDLKDISNGEGIVNAGVCKRCGSLHKIDPDAEIRVEVPLPRENPDA